MSSSRLKLLENHPKVVKMYAWEVPFSKMVSEVRAEEVKQIRYASYLKALYLGVTMLMGRFILFICVVAYSLMGHSLSPNVTFSLSTYLYILQVTVGMRLPQALLVLAECMTSVKRLEVGPKRPPGIQIFNGDVYFSRNSCS